MTTQYRNLDIDIPTGNIDSNRNTLIQKTAYNKGEEDTSFEERIFLAIKGKLDEIVSPDQVLGDYNYLSDKNEILKSLEEKGNNISQTKLLPDETIIQNSKINIDNWIENEEKNIENSIINNARYTLKWLTGLGYTNYPDHIPSETEKVIFTYALKHGIYTEDEIDNIKFDHGETKEYYIENYGTNSEEELLLKLQKNGEKETGKLRKYKKNNPEEKSSLGLCSGTCC